MAPDEKVFPEGMEPLQDKDFSFKCYPEVRCYNICCNKVDLVLYPYDVIRLKNNLQINSEQFLQEYAFLARLNNPFFPAVMMKMNAEEKCPFLAENGCRVYRDRPFSCRMYPLERAVSRKARREGIEEFYFIKKHPYCLGHFELKNHNIKEWIRSQGLIEYNSMNDIWVEIDTIFTENPWKGEGSGGEKQQLAFMVCYNIDGFRRFAEHHRLLDMFKLEKDFKNRIKREDEALQKFGFEWLKIILGKASMLCRK